MATKTSKNLTLADWAKRQDPSGKTAKIVELLAETNEIIEDMVYIEANSDLGHTSFTKNWVTCCCLQKNESRRTVRKIKSCSDY